MQVKKFEATTLQEALEHVKRELGPEAIILQTRKNKRGFGLMSSGSVEVTAAVSERAMIKKQVGDSRLTPKAKQALSKMSTGSQAEFYDQALDSHLEKAMASRGRGDQVSLSSPGESPRQPPGSAPARANSNVKAAGGGAEQAGAPTYSASSAARPATRITATRYADIEDDDSDLASPRRPDQARRRSNQQISPAISNDAVPGHVAAREAPSRPAVGAPTLEEEVMHLKRMLVDLKTGQEEGHGSAVGPTAAQSFARENGLTHPNLQDAFEQLILSGLDRKSTLQLVRKLAFELGEGISDAELVLDQLAQEILASVKTLDVEFKPKGAMERPKVLCLVGPTGVGKTTTVAKIASLASLRHKLKVGFVNLDQFKVAANDQLATYARVLGVPFRAAADAEELKAALLDFEGLDLVILDTAGRSHRDPEALARMKDLVGTAGEVQTHLVLSATTRDAELTDIASRFGIFRPAGLIVSKLDEATVYGSIHGIGQRSRVPFSFFTTGQRVPEDIEPATAERLTALLLDIGV